MIEETNLEKLDKKIETWKNKLIDLSRRNRLLNFKPTKVTTIKIIDEIPSEVFKSMVSENKSFNFLPKEKNDLIENNQKDDEILITEFFEYETEELEDKHTDLNLQTNLTEEQLGKNLKRIQFRANQLMEEQGYNILYLTLGMVEWYEAEQSHVKNRSPLIMLPVELKKRSIKSKYKLYKSDEESFINPALQYKLSSDFNFNLPDLPLEDESIAPQEYLKTVKDLIKSNSRWKITNEIYLGLFSFAKFVMFKDLEKYNVIFKNNEIVKALAGVTRLDQNGTESEYITADELDEKRKPLELFQVLDADSSQQEAIEAVKAGNSIVIQGPPGTGKSQTITNLIAEILANGKKILFVSEKMAALNVVYKRLQNVGLGEYCLEIHSRKANKRHVLNQLKDAYESKHPGKPLIEDKIEVLLSKRKQLNEYSKILHKPADPFGKTPYWFIGQLNQVREIEFIDIDFSNLSHISFAQYKAIISTIETLKARMEMIGHPHKHPFWGCEIKTINEYQQQKLESNINKTKSALSELNDLLNKFSSEINIKLPNLSLVVSYCNLLTLLSEDHHLPASLAKINAVDEFIRDLKPVLKNIDTYQQHKNKIILKRYKENIFDEDIGGILEKLTTSYRRIWRIFFPEYHKIRKFIKKQFVEKISIHYSDLLNDIEGIKLNIDMKNQIESTSEIITKPLSSLWLKTETQTKDVFHNIEWLRKYKGSRISKTDDEKLIKFVLNSDDIPEELIDLKNSIEIAILQLKEKINELNYTLMVTDEIIFPSGIDNVMLKDLYEILNRWKNNIHLIVDWARYQREYDNCKKVGLQNYLEKILFLEIEPTELIQKFKKSFLFHLFQKVLDANPILKEFEALKQDQTLKKFQELDTFQLELAKLRVLNNLYDNKPDNSWEGTKSSQLGYLQRQFRLKRGHHPIRKILVNVPTIIQQLCPCFMMSPISLSQYIDPEVAKFDFIIFDEASQMSPVDSLGAIIRGDNLVCVGDTKQLPPTTFFDRVAQTLSDNDDFDDLSTPDLESILDECLTIGIKEFYLRWHYRSRHESLIHFSNKSFYKNNLNTFPSPNRDTKELGLSLVHIKNSIYDRGGNQQNSKEARKVAEEVFNHFKTYPDKTLGVGTFSQSQQTAIYDELEFLRKDDPSLERFFMGSMAEPFFVKNLETIQGDERDVIFISIGYGRDANGKLTMNFGPLNREGGERRLNVLVTRARDKVVVFSSILGNDFDLTKTKALGVHKLKQYLDFAKSDGDQSLLDNVPDYSSNFDESNIFERSVYQQLQKKGVKVIPQVGYAGYKIDFGILHPDIPSKFILAVECDGASYHSSFTARDRDRLRQQVLENLGWRFHRIWSTDWFLNPSREMAKLLEVIDNAKNNPLNLNGKPTISVINIENVDPNINNDNSGIEIISYKKYPVTFKGFPDNFYQEVESSYEIENLIEEIVKVESPIHIKELALRVIQHFKMGKVGAKILRIMESLVKRLHNDGKINYSNGFIYTSKEPYKNIRRRDTSDAVTNVELIPKDEIQNAIMLVLGKEISVPREELIAKVARVFGFQHTGKKIQDHVSKQIMFLLRRKIIFNLPYGLQKIK